MRQARIYRPSRSATSSGKARTRGWILEFAPESARQIDPLMGWTSSADTQGQVRLRFPTREAAEAYAREHGLDAVVVNPAPQRRNLRPGGYGDNFSSRRRIAWTH